MVLTACIIREVTVMSQKMAGFVLASMADPQRKSFGVF